jgi:nucleoside-diphosphate-sugar epimerase
VRVADVRFATEVAAMAHEYSEVDLRDASSCDQVTRGIDEIYHLAANMGGIGFIERNKAAIVRDNSLIDLGILHAAKGNSVDKLLFASSACVYPRGLQSGSQATRLRESDAYPADPEDGYGWQKLTTERLCRHYMEEFQLDVRIARLHNIFGPCGAWNNGREKYPAALCRKVAEAREGDDLPLWGDGSQLRSYCYVSDCVEALQLLMASDYTEAVNVGQDVEISVRDMADLVCDIAGKRLHKVYDWSAPVGVAARNADISLIHGITGWAPCVSLEAGLARTYAWVSEQVSRNPSADVVSS